MSGTITITPGYTFPSDTTALTTARLNALGTPTAQVDAGAITSRELSTSILPVDPTIRAILYEDFLLDNGISNVIGSCGLRTVASGTAASVAIGTSVAGHPGTARFVDTSDATGYCFIRGSSATANSIVLGGGQVEITWLIGKLSALSTGTDTYNLWVGLANGAASGAEPTDGIYFAYTHGTNSGNWVGKTANGSSRTSVNSSVPMAITSWFTLKAVANAAATSVEFFINGTSIGTASTLGNIPTTALTPICGMQTTVGTAASISFEADYMKLMVDLTNTR